MAFSITDILGGSLADAIKGIISDFKADPTVKLQLQAAVEQNATLLEQKQIEFQEKLEDSHQAEVNASSKNIVSEEGSGDKLTQRARPLGLYVFYVILIFNFVVYPVWKGSFLNLPDLLWYTFISGYLGYGAYREVGKFLALPGESALKLPGISIANKQ